MTYFEKIRHLYNIPQDENIGFAESEIAVMEKAMNITLPAKLREYYLTLGKHEALNNSYNRLLEPQGGVAFSDDGYLVFYEENQGVVNWGMKKDDLQQPDPAVYGGYTDDKGNFNWYLELPATETSLLMLAVYNGVLGGLKYNGNFLEGVKPEVVNYIKANWQELPDISSNVQRIFTRDYEEVISLSIDSEKNCSGIFIGTNDEDRFNKMIDTLDVDWFYLSTEDMDDYEEED